tara:strand:+ start:487 stop:693 length:207 start_codon:yes stop_codon:yes gene_type:complete
MNEDNLNMEIRKFLKKVGITSQRIIEKEIQKGFQDGLIKIDDEIDLQMTLNIKSLSENNVISGKIKID